MPNASRYLEPGYTYHLTHRCHDRRFLLKFGRDRDLYRHWLREGARRPLISHHEVGFVPPFRLDPCHSYTDPAGPDTQSLLDARRIQPAVPHNSRIHSAFHRLTKKGKAAYLVAHDKGK